MSTRTSAWRAFFRASASSFCRSRLLGPFSLGAPSAPSAALSFRFRFRSGSALRSRFFFFFSPPSPPPSPLLLEPERSLCLPSLPLGLRCSPARLLSLEEDLASPLLFPSLSFFRRSDLAVCLRCDKNVYLAWWGGGVSGWRIAEERAVRGDPV